MRLNSCPAVVSHSCKTLMFTFVKPSFFYILLPASFLFLLADQANNTFLIHVRNGNWKCDINVQIKTGCS